jgi:putative transcriptional regulator
MNIAVVLKDYIFHHNFITMLELEENRLLIADPFLKDEHFGRSVIYLCKHSEEGSFGFVLNKIFEQTLDELFDGLEGYAIPVFIGGPVEPDTIHFLHQYPNQIKGSYPLNNGLCWGGDFDDVKKLILRNEYDSQKIKFFIGYSGWDASQLITELKEKTWLIADAPARIVFEMNTEHIWKESILLLGKDYEMMANFPIDPQLN